MRGIKEEEEEMEIEEEERKGKNEKERKKDLLSVCKLYLKKERKNATASKVILRVLETEKVRKKERKKETNFFL